MNIEFSDGSEKNCYVYARIKDERTTLVILNGRDEDQLLEIDRYGDVTGSYTRGVDVITDRELEVTNQINVPARGVLVMGLK
jgi:neopullulanase